MAKKSRKKKIKVTGGEEQEGEMKAQPVENQVNEAQVESQVTDGNENGDGPVLEADAVVDLATELEAAKSRAQEATDQYVRLLAEFDNFRRRTRRETAALREYASESVLTALLTVLDDFDRTLTVMDKTDNLSSIKDGVNLVTEKLHRVLEKEGLNSINAIGNEFDSELHEAIQTMSVPDKSQKGKVLEEAEKGYRLKDKVIRYAKVIVGE